MRQPEQVETFITNDSMIFLLVRGANTGWRVSFAALRAAKSEARSGSDRWWQIQSCRETYRRIASGWDIRIDLDREFRGLLHDLGDRMNAEQILEIRRKVENSSKHHDLRAA